MFYKKSPGFVLRVAVICVAIAFLSSCSSKKVVIPSLKPEAIRVDILNLLENGKREAVKTLKERYEEVSVLLALCKGIRNDMTKLGAPVSCISSLLEKVDRDCEAIDIINEKPMKGQNYKTAYLNLKKKMLTNSNFIKLFKDRVEKNFLYVFQGYIYQNHYSPHMQSVLQFTEDDLPSWLSKCVLFM